MDLSTQSVLNSAESGPIRQVCTIPGHGLQVLPRSHESLLPFPWNIIASMNPESTQSAIDERLQSRRDGLPARLATATAELWTRCYGPDEAPEVNSGRHVGPGPWPGLRRPSQMCFWCLQNLIGIGFLVPLLALLAAIPGVSLLTLGMMLNAQAEVGRTGRFASGFPLLPISTRVGTIGFMCLLTLIPVLLASQVADGQSVIAELSGLPQQSFTVGTRILQAVAFVVMALALACGGRLRDFLWPFQRFPQTTMGLSILVIAFFVALILCVVSPPLMGVFGLLLLLSAVIRTVRNVPKLTALIQSGEWTESVNFWSERLIELFQPWHHFKLGLKAAAGALMWLALPTFLLSLGTAAPRQNPGPGYFASFVGGILLIPVAAWLPLLQCHQATTGRFAAIFEIKTAREIIRRVPLRWAIATILLYGLAIPLYLSKIVVPPADATFLFTPLFILIIYPCRILMAWVYGSGLARETSTTRLVRWPVKVFIVPIIGFYSLIVFFIPLISEAGTRAMYENHAFLLPIPAGLLGQ